MQYVFAILFFLSARSVGYVRINVGDTLAIHVLSKGVQKIFFKCMTEWKQTPLFMLQWTYRGLVVMVFNATFNNISFISWGVSFIGGRNQSTRRKPPTCRKSI